MLTIRFNETTETLSFRSRFFQDVYILTQMRTRTPELIIHSARQVVETTNIRMKVTRPSYWFTLAGFPCELPCTLKSYWEDSTVHTSYAYTNYGKTLRNAKLQRSASKMTSITTLSKASKILPVARSTLINCFAGQNLNGTQQKDPVENRPHPAIEGRRLSTLPLPPKVSVRSPRSSAM
jgi:hypothetical protein